MVRPTGGRSSAPQPARWTLPALRQLVQTYRRFGVPFTMARTRCTFGSHRFGVRRWEWETAIPKNGFFPQMSQTAAMAGEGTKAVSDGVALRRS